MNSITRAGLWAAVAVPFLYFGAQAAAIPYFPDFSFARHTASLLGSDHSSKPEVLNTGAALTGIASLMAAWGMFAGLRLRGVWISVALLVACCCVSFGLASLWAAAHPLPDPRHNPGALGVGMFAAPFATLLAAICLKGATWLRSYLLVNIAGFCLVASMYSGILPIDLAEYAGAVQRLGTFVMLVPISVMAFWLLKNAPVSPKFAGR